MLALIESLSYEVILVRLFQSGSTICGSTKCGSIKCGSSLRSSIAGSPEPVVRQTGVCLRATLLGSIEWPVVRDGANVGRRESAVVNTWLLLLILRLKLVWLV
jgi:hypothetical protein